MRIQNALFSYLLDIIRTPYTHENPTVFDARTSMHRALCPLFCKVKIFQKVTILNICKDTHKQYVFFSCIDYFGFQK